MEAASCRSAAGKAARVGLLQAEQRRSNGGQLQAEQPKVNMVLQAGQQGIGKLRAEQQRLNQNQLQAWQRSVRVVVQYQRQ